LWRRAHGTRGAGLYGGQIIAQALRAAALTVDPAYRLHSLHAYFIRLGDAAEPIRLEVDRIRNGRTFLTRLVGGRQAVVHSQHVGVFSISRRQAPTCRREHMPQVAAPDALSSDSWSPFFERALSPRDIGPGRVGAWMRMVEDFGDDPILNACALAFLSDDLPTDAVVALHPNRRYGAARSAGSGTPASTMPSGFTNPARTKDWPLARLLRSHGLAGARGLSVGSIFDRTGRQVANGSCRKSLIRPVRAG